MKIFEITIFGLNIAPSYYWLAYAISFLLGYLLFKKRKTLTITETDSLLLYVFFGVIVWWRMGYVIFYNPGYYLQNLTEIFQIWKWWMSFHWGLLGVIIWVVIFAFRSKNKHKPKYFFQITDNLATVFPIGLFFGRIGNYLNKELLWMKYDWFLAVQKNWYNYFPSPLLESLLEGILLFLITNYFYKRQKNTWITSWIFLVFYSIFRFLVEFVRLPDEQLGYLFLWLTMWQILCIPMFVIWLLIILKLDFE